MLHMFTREGDFNARERDEQFQEIQKVLTNSQISNRIPTLCRKSPVNLLNFTERVVVGGGLNSSLYFLHRLITHRY